MYIKALVTYAKKHQQSIIIMYSAFCIHLSSLSDSAAPVALLTRKTARRHKVWPVA